MAMIGKELGLQIANAIMDKDTPAEARATIQKNWEVIGNIIVEYIQSNAQVLVNPLLVPAGVLAVASAPGSAIGTIPQNTGTIQ